jgi:predicted acetyltransferase
MSDLTIRPATDDDFLQMTVVDARAFGDVWKDEDRELFRPNADLARFRLALDGDDIVGIAGSYGMQLTVPGRAQVPAGGVTWVAVAVSHRRRGLLRRLMSAIHDDIAARGEPLAMLTASEGGIYDRFGYGVATRWRVVEIDRRRTQIADRHRPDDRVRIATPGDHVEEIHAIFDRYRRARVGAVNRSLNWIGLRLHDHGEGATLALHPDGFAIWKVTEDWNDGFPAHRVQLFDVIACTDDAHAALWNAVLSIDLAGPVRSVGAVAEDDPLPYLLTDPRQVRTTNLNDMLWIRPMDVPAALSARTYGTDDRLTVELVDDGSPGGGARWRIDGAPDGAEVKKVRTKADLVTDRASLGAMYLGGVRPSSLAAGRRLESRSEDVLPRADHFFSSLQRPHCNTGF